MNKNKRVQQGYTLTLLFALAVILSLPVRGQNADRAAVADYEILQLFIASGSMGDINNIQLYESWIDTPYDSTDVDSSAIKVIYTPGSLGWAGIYWQNRANNWGEYPGEDLSDSSYTEISFWARGETGRERVEFKAGDINDAQLPHRDSFRSTIGRIALSKAWKKYSISLRNKDLSSVIGGFCWVASGNANPRGLTFYLDDVRYIAR